MSPTYVSAIVVVIVGVFSLFGKQLDTPFITSMVEAVVTIAAGLFIAYRRYIKGDITVTGMPKE